MNEQVCGQLTLFQEDSPASHFPRPGSSEARKMTVTSGQKWLGLSRNCGPLGLLEKMLLESSIWHSTRCYLTWRAKDTPHGHFLYQLQVLMPHTSDTGPQSWPTPTASDSFVGNLKSSEQKEGSRHSLNLADAVKMWPTPTASDVVNKKIGNPIITKNGTIRHKNKAGGQSLMNLCQVAKLFPTPTAQDFKRRGPNSRQQGLPEMVMRYATPQARDYRTGQKERWESQERSRNLNDQIAAEGNQMEPGSGQLNPTWVEWLMGFPTGWTESSASETR